MRARILVQTWDGGQLVVDNDIVYASMQNGLVCSWRSADGSFIACDALTQDKIAPSVTLVGDASQ